MSSIIPNITTGDDVAIPVTLKKDGETFSIDTGATVEARLVSTDNETTYSSSVTQSYSASGADWGNSLVVIEFASADTADITFQGLAKLEIQVDDGGKLTWFGQVTITKGNIT